MYQIYSGNKTLNLRKIQKGLILFEKYILGNDDMAFTCILSLMFDNVLFEFFSGWVSKKIEGSVISLGSLEKKFKVILHAKNNKSERIIMFSQ